MLNYLDLTFVGPSPHMRLDFAPRLNLLTGDNSLGKTFVLDVAWWALTQTWPGKEEKKAMAWPLPGRRKEATIRSSFGARTNSDVPRVSSFDVRKETWPLRKGRPGNPGLILYLRIDGGFSLWDPARNYYKSIKSRGYESPDRPKAFHFEMNDIWKGLSTEDRETVFCEGLLSDWKTWKDRQGDEYVLLKEVLRALSPHPDDRIEIGDFMRLSIDDVRDIPVLHMPFGPVPVTLASAGLKRGVALAYLITWAHSEHLQACKLIGDEPSDRFIVLIDEVELHLHPQWQRTILPALLKVIRSLGKEKAIFSGGMYTDIQVIASTHAPLVMASVETYCDKDNDRLFHFQLNNREVTVEQAPLAKEGDANSWLESETFGLRQAYSREAEKAIEAAESFMSARYAELPPDLTTREAIHEELKRTLSADDPFWPRWL